MITYCMFSCFGFSDFPVVSHSKGTFRRTILFFCIGLGLIAGKTISEALEFRPKSVLSYAIDNNLFEAQGWVQVCVLAQKTSDDVMLDKIIRRVV
jgi:hypothetical protein